MFDRAASVNLEERPATTAALLEWPNSRHTTLAKLAQHDRAVRTVHGKYNLIARDSLTSNVDFVTRRVALVVLKKALFLYYYVEGKQHIAMHTGLPELWNMPT